MKWKVHYFQNTHSSGYLTLTNYSMKDNNDEHALGWKVLHRKESDCRWVSPSEKGSLSQMVENLSSRRPADEKTTLFIFTLTLMSSNSSTRLTSLTYCCSSALKSRTFKSILSKSINFNHWQSWAFGVCDSAWWFKRLLHPHYNNNLPLGL